LACIGCFLLTNESFCFTNFLTSNGYFTVSVFFWFLWLYVGRWSLTLLDLFYFINMGIRFFNIFDRDLNRVALRVAGGHGESRNIEELRDRAKPIK